MTTYTAEIFKKTHLIKCIARSESEATNIATIFLKEKNIKYDKLKVSKINKNPGSVKSSKHKPIRFNKEQYIHMHTKYLYSILTGCEKASINDIVNIEKCISDVLKRKGYKVLPFIDKSIKMPKRCFNVTVYKRDNINTFPTELYKAYEVVKEEMQKIDNSILVELNRVYTDDDIGVRKATNFSKKQIKQIDLVENEIFKICKAMIHGDSIDWDYDIIGDAADYVAEYLIDTGKRVYYPAMIEDDKTGECFIHDFYGE